MALNSKRIQAVFQTAVEKPDSAVRAAILDRECGGDDDLRRCVEVLIQLHDQPPDPHDHAAQPGRDFTTDDAAKPIDGSAPTVDQARSQANREGPGTLIGPYKLLQLIGEGGMGAVYMAEQEKPVRRRVAIKIIKAGMDTAQVIARFEAERQALAMMDHHNIARVLDAGTTESGRPYFVMELVHGVPITQYCDDAQLTPRERLELFIPVCQAIQHAHHKGIIHRDIKPSNVLVTMYDGKPVAKVIDFGVAKATEQKLTELTMFTQYGAIIGTLEYMSPEQAEMSALGVDTRSDIYSLGVVLYELLTGSTPLERAKLRERGFAEILKRIKEEEPARPSTRLSSSADSLPAISSRRRTEPEKLKRLMRGELDWIVMKALEKDRTRRYETANSFAGDIQRYLDDEAVEACPPSTSYRLSKFARRHRGELTAVSTIAALLVVGAGLSAWQAIRATRAEHTAERDARRAIIAEGKASVERDRARSAETAALASEGRARSEGEKAKKSAAEAKAVLRFFEDNVLAATRPEGQSGGLGKDVTIRQALDAAEPKIAEAFRDQPLAEAAIREQLGSTYRYLGERESAVAQYERALKIRVAELGPDHAQTIASKQALAVAYGQVGEGRRAIKMLEEVVANRKAKLGADHPSTLNAQNSLALTYAIEGQIDRATKLFESTLAAQKVKPGPGHGDTLATQRNLGLAYFRLGKLNQAIALFEETLAVRTAKLGADDLLTAASMVDLADVCVSDKQFERGTKLYERAIKIHTVKQGADHPKTLYARGALGHCYESAGTPTLAEPILRESLALVSKKLGADHVDVASALADLGRNLIQQKKYVEAEPFLRDSLAIREKKIPKQWGRFYAQSLLGESLCGQKKYAEAEPHLLAGYEGLTAKKERIPFFLNLFEKAGKRVVDLYDAWGKPDKAAEWRAKLAPPTVEGKPRP